MKKADDEIKKRCDNELFGRTSEYLQRGRVNLRHKSVDYEGINEAERMNIIEKRYNDNFNYYNHSFESLNDNMILIYQPEDFDKFMIEFHKQNRFNDYEVIDEGAYKIIYLNHLSSNEQIDNENVKPFKLNFTVPGIYEINEDQDVKYKQFLSRLEYIGVNKPLVINGLKDIDTYISYIETIFYELNEFVFESTHEKINAVTVIAFKFIQTQ